MTAPKALEATMSRASWIRTLQSAVRDVAELAALLELPVDALAAPRALPFPLLVPRGFVARMRKRDARDPLLLQVLPQAAEGVAVAGFGRDPVGEHPLADCGLIEKYPGRALLIASGACPIHCRYCFRREFPYAEQLAARANFGPALDRLRARPDVGEVILSGGDPLSLTNRRLAMLIRSLESIETVRTLRIHTRFPITIPERIDPGLLALLAATRLAVVVVVHCNHPNELDADVELALRALHSVVDALLNQSVLLRGINDDVATLAALSMRLFGCRTLPYYLHLLDPVAGSAHFDVDAATGRALVSGLRQRVAGYLVPTLVREVPGELSKTPL
jgi:EF-P beta-lysylation protein EpmB